MQFEHLDVHGSYGHTSVLINEPAIAPQGEARPNTQIFRDLAARMGFDEACFADSDEAMARVAFGDAVSFDALREQGWVQLARVEAPFAEGGFATPSGRCMIDAPGLGVPDFVANYESAQMTPELARRFPLAMISPPARNFLNSSFVNVASLRDIEGEPRLEMHAADAAARGLVDGQQVRAVNDRGHSVFRLIVSERARPGVVNGLGIWWRKLGFDGSNVNELTHQRLTDIGRGPSFYDCLVEVEAA
jgi:anaerobic selenocysteine-containing dehydrogenase